jgi:hypothetical protein
LINGFFLDGGAPVVVGALLLGASDAVFGATSPVSGAIKAFFTGYPPAVGDGDPGASGIPGLTHFIIDSLLGTVAPSLFSAKLAPKTAKTTLATERSVKPGATADLPEANEPIDADAKTVTLSIATPAKAKKPEAPGGKSDPAPVVDPTASTPDDETGKAEDVTEEIKEGNKAEVDPLLLESHTGGGLAEALQTWNHFLKKLIGGGKTPAPATGSTTPAPTPAAPASAPAAETEPAAAQAPIK